MNFVDIPIGTSVFIDANVLVYHFAPHPIFLAPCQELLERVSLGEIAGFTSSDVASDAAHRLMTIEAADMYGWPMNGISYRLQRHSNELKALTRFRNAIEDIPRFGVQVLTVAMAEVLTAAAISQQHGLLSGDALVVAIMQRNGITRLASNDSDFDRVPWIERFAPC
jgi:predicted nucleic acid-binding protein